jgi:fructoselysine-6-P-deglycase FrlB-like protein
MIDTMSEFLQKYYDGILLQKTGIPDTLSLVSNESIIPLLDRRLILLTGAGDSYAVAEYGQWAMTHARRVAVAVSPPEIERYALDKDCLVIGISASGRSLSTLKALRHAKGEGAHTLILTDNPESDSLDVADFQWVTNSGIDTFDIAPAAPTTAAMAFLIKTAAQIIALPSEGIYNDSEIMERDMSEIVKWAESEGKRLADFIDVDQVLYLISEGPNYVAAHIGMMKFNEFSLQRTVVSLKEEFQHHYNLSLEEGNRAVLISDSPSTENDEQYIGVLRDTLDVPSYHLFTSEDCNLQSPLGQAIANTIALQMAAYYVVLKHKPDMDWFKMPNAKAFKIY